LTNVVDATYQIVNEDSKRSTLEVWMSYGLVEPDESKPGKFKSVDDRICPCKPAIEKELPEDGICHCQIFCTPEYREAHS